MKRSHLLCLLLMALAPVSHAYPEYANKWHHIFGHRSVLFFAPSHDNFVEQFLFETRFHTCELNDRQIFTLVVTEDGKTFPAETGLDFNFDALAQQYAIPKGKHTAILIGKDGGEKHRWGAKTDWQYISDLIDTMPLRQQEAAGRISPCQA